MLKNFVLARSLARAVESMFRYISDHHTDFNNRTETAKHGSFHIHISLR